MAKSKESKKKGSKPNVKVNDLKPKKDPKGGKGQEKYLEIKLDSVLISS